MSKQSHHPLVLEFTVISAQCLKNNSSFFFPQRLRPFITLTTYSTNSCLPVNTDKQHYIYQTSIDEEGENNPTWGDKFHLPIDTTFFSQNYSSSIYLQIFSKRLVFGNAHLGWCQIPATDIVEGFRPPGLVRYLSYRVRDRDGSRGEGVINVGVKLVGQAPVFSGETSNSGETLFSSPGKCQTVVGIPLTLFPGNR